MGRATLVLDADTSAIRRAMGEIPGITQRSQAVMTAQARRGGRERVGIDQTFAREHESISQRLARARERLAKEETRKIAAELRRQTQSDAQFARERDSIHARLARANEKRERDATAKAVAEGRKQVQADGAFASLKDSISQQLARARAKAERDATRAAETEGRRQVRADAQFARERDSIHARLAAARVARERAAKREVDRLTRERRATGREVGGQVANTATQALTGAHDRTQAARQTAAERTSAINTALVQRGTSQSENEADNAMIQARLRQVRTGVAPETAIAAIASAQTAANALGGDTREKRIEGIEATLGDVELAGAIDPTNVTGIVNMGAILRRRVSDPAMRQRILRGAVGTALEGSVETDQMVTQGLPGLLAAISSGTANASPADRDRITAEISQDFFAQLQAQAAGGRTVGVSANRTNTVRTALSNAPRQNRLGLALAETARTGTPEQQAAFAAAFTKNAAGEYSMNADVRDTPSNAARFFGTMFNNDAGALRNAMGTHGLGGNAQLMNAPDVAAIASYFGMTTGRNGEQIREYDHVNQLKQSTLTPEQEATMRATRASEDRTRLMREQESAAANARSPGLFTRASDALTSFATANPLTAMLGGGAASTGLAAGAKSLGGWALASLGAGPAALAALAVGAGTGLGLYGDAKGAGSGVDAQGHRLSTGERASRGVAATVAESLFSGAAIIPLFRELISAVERIGTAPVTATVSPHDAAHAASATPPPGAARRER